jgi:hypothetical protein
VGRANDRANLARPVVTSSFLSDPVRRTSGDETDELKVSAETRVGVSDACPTDARNEIRRGREGRCDQSDAGGDGGEIGTAVWIDLFPAGCFITIQYQAVGDPMHGHCRGTRGSPLPCRDH